MVERILQTEPPPHRDTTATSELPSAQPEPNVRAGDELVEADLLVEEVSIDGMCGVY